MPKYSYKMRLKRYLIKHGECDRLTEYLILKGCSESEAESGLEPFVDSWEEAVKWAVRAVSEVDIDYYYVCIKGLSSILFCSMLLKSR